MASWAAACRFLHIFANRRGFMPVAVTVQKESLLCHVFAANLLCKGDGINANKFGAV